MSGDPRDYKLDLSGLPPDNAGKPQNRPYLSVQFDCCKVYQRIYQTKGSTDYRGACPRCGKRVNFTVGAGGTDARFFVVE